MLKTIGPIHWLVAASAVCAGGCSIDTRPPAYPERPVIYEAAQPLPAVAPEPVVIHAPPAPPPGPPLPPPPPSSADQDWIAGHHRWNGRTYVWYPAHDERRPHPHARYVPGHWERRGRGHIWIEGHWD
jgi:hypothetical protein